MGDGAPLPKSIYTQQLKAHVRQPPTRTHTQTPVVRAPVPMKHRSRGGVENGQSISVYFVLFLHLGFHSVVGFRFLFPWCTVRPNHDDSDKSQYPPCTAKDAGGWVRVCEHCDAALLHDGVHLSRTHTPTCNVVGVFPSPGNNTAVPLLFSGFPSLCAVQGQGRRVGRGDAHTGTIIRSGSAAAQYKQAHVALMLFPSLP